MYVCVGMGVYVYRVWLTFSNLMLFPTICCVHVRLCVNILSKRCMTNKQKMICVMVEMIVVFVVAMMVVWMMGSNRLDCCAIVKTEAEIG